MWWRRKKINFKTPNFWNTYDFLHFHCHIFCLLVPSTKKELERRTEQKTLFFVTFDIRHIEICHLAVILHYSIRTLWFCHSSNGQGLGVVLHDSPGLPRSRTIKVSGSSLFKVIIGQDRRKERKEKTKTGQIVTRNRWYRSEFVLACFF